MTTVEPVTTGRGTYVVTVRQTQWITYQVTTAVEGVTSPEQAMDFIRQADIETLDDCQIHEESSDAVVVSAELTESEPTKTVPAVCWVYWNGQEQGGGGFLWFTTAAEADEAFAREVQAWRDQPVTVRRVDVPEVPIELDGQALTDYLDGEAHEDLEVHLPALQVHDTSPPDLTAPSTQEQARDSAIQWQHWMAERSMSYGELAGWQSRLRDLAERFDLTEEFRENGLI